MKKITIFLLFAICAMFCFHADTYAAVNAVSEDIQTAWKFSGNNPKTGITGNYTIKTHTEWDIQYTHIAAATEIYKNGAKFCRISLVHNWTKWSVYIAPDSCRTICKDGYYGSKCTSTQPSNSCEDKNLDTIFDKNTSPSPWQEKDIDGFYNSNTDAILLEIVSASAHEVTVRPVEFYGKNTNKIESVNTRGETFDLCAPGYKRENGECKKTSACKCQTGQGFKDKNDLTCITCNESRKVGVSSDGVCHLCKRGEFFNGTSCSDALHKITKQKMAECYMDSDFESCAKS